MRILQINSAKEWGGGEAHVLALCNELTARGHQVILACRKNSKIAKQSQLNGIRTHPAPLRSAADIVSAYQLAKLCQKQGISIVHAHLGRDYWIAYFIKFFYPSVKIVFTRHLLFPLKRGYFHKRLYQSAAAIIAVSQGVKKVILDTGFVEDKVVQVIHNGISLGEFQTEEPSFFRTEIGVKETDFLIGVVGQLSEHKGQDIFLQSVPAILKECSNAKFVLVGSEFGDGSYQAGLLKLIAEQKVQDAVILAGRRTDIPQVMKSLDVFVSASRSEAFGMVIAEAMASGVPVVATCTAGAMEIIADKVDGLLVEMENPKALATAVVEILKKDSLFRQFKEKGKEKIAAQFSQQQMIDKIQELYQKILIRR